MIEETAVPCPYNIILGRDTAVPSPNFLPQLDRNELIPDFFKKSGI
jgi:hypothetical protein